MGVAVFDERTSCVSVLLCHASIDYLPCTPYDDDCWSTVQTPSPISDLQPASWQEKASLSQTNYQYQTFYVFLHSNWLLRYTLDLNQQVVKSRFARIKAGQSRDSHPDFIINIWYCFALHMILINTFRLDFGGENMTGHVNSLDQGHVCNLISCNTWSCVFGTFINPSLEFV